VSGATLTADFDARDASRALGAIARAGRQPGMLLKPIGAALVRGVRDRMVSQVDPEGNPWEPLQPWYQAMKRNSRILTESGRLAGSIVAEVGGGTVAVGSKLPYAAVHQFSATITAKNGGMLIFRTANGAAWGAAREVFVPARPYLGISSADERAIGEVVEAVLWRVARL
jgi:phage virion morphogenesis protein